MDMAVKDISHLSENFLFSERAVEQVKGRIVNGREGKFDFFEQGRVASSKRYTCAVFRIVL